MKLILICLSAITLTDDKALSSEDFLEIKITPKMHRQHFRGNLIQLSFLLIPGIKVKSIGMHEIISYITGVIISPTASTII